MSVTIRDLLILPSLRKARVVAGEKGLSRIVSSISVLEYAEPTILQDELFNSSQFYGSELVITAFFSVKNDIEAQCSSIRRLHTVGEVGLILYYVGIVLPSISQKVIDLADELEFPLICMPENRKDLRYSEVIYEVMKAIIKDQKEDTYLVGEMLERISLLPTHQRSMDTVLRMLRDRLTCSFFLLDSNLVTMNLANWPTNGNIDLAQVFAYYENDIHKIPEEAEMIVLQQAMSIVCSKIRNENTQPMYLLCIKENGVLQMDMCRQATEIVQLFVNIWSKKHGNVGREELINAILNDEPVKMRRLADFLHIDVGSIHSMLLLLPEKPIGNGKKLKDFNKRIQNKVKSYIEDNCLISMTGIYNDVLVVFTGEEQIKGSYDMMTAVLMEDLKKSGEEVILVSNLGLNNTREVRNAYITCVNNIKDARCIFPDKYAITLQAVRFTEACKEIISCGEDQIDNTLSVLRPISDMEEELNQELMRTLEIYLLDANMSVIRTSELMFVHKNTIKYRINKLNERFNYKINKMPETYDLYKAVAIRRLFYNLKMQDNSK